MATNSKIEWCDHTASPWYGCAKVHEGCEHCYAEAMSHRNPGTLGVWGDEGVRVKSKSFIKNLQKWNALGERLQKRQLVFPSLCDPFEDRPELVPWRREMFDAIDRLPWVTLLLLTKRPENIRRMWPAGTLQPPLKRVEYFNATGEDAPRTDQEKPRRHNVWLGLSVSLDHHIPDIVQLHSCRDLAPVQFLSCEPLLGQLHIPQVWMRDESIKRWVIAGGESGPHARPMHPDLARSLRDQCQADGVPFFFKQWGEYVYLDQATDDTAAKIDASFNAAAFDAADDVPWKVGKKAAGRLLDGVEHSEFPKQEDQPCEPVRSETAYV